MRALLVTLACAAAWCQGPQGVGQALPQLTSADRHRVIQAVAADVRQHYFDRQVTEAAASVLLAHEQAGDYNAVTEGQAFADLLARHLTEASRDNHFTVEYTPNVFPDFSKRPAPELDEQYRASMERLNCTFERVEIRQNNVGYMKLNSFPQLAVCRSKAESVMTYLNRGAALVFDLRDNRGGYADMVVFLASYLFDHPEYIFNPGGPFNEQAWTRSPVAGSLLANKPVYILTSSRTYSAAEQFSYDLKMLRRATLSAKPPAEPITLMFSTMSTITSR